MDFATLLNDLGDAVNSAKAKADVVSELRAAFARELAERRAELDAYTAEKQAEIDAAAADYTDAKVAADRLQAQARDLIGQILPVPDQRFRVSS